LEHQNPSKEGQLTEAKHKKTALFFIFWEELSKMQNLQYLVLLIL
jgi:hypothetical protein